MQRLCFVSGLCLLLWISGGCARVDSATDSAPPTRPDSSPADVEVSREERVERTRIVLEAVLFEDAAIREAERLVDLCEDDAVEMFFADDLAGNPEGPELFNSLKEAMNSGSHPYIGIGLASSACTRADYDAVLGVGRI